MHQVVLDLPLRVAFLKVGGEDLRFQVGFQGEKDGGGFVIREIGVE